MFRIVFRKKAAKELRKLPSATLKKTVKAIDDLAENPRPNGSKKLKASDENMWRIRVGDYRVIYLLEETIKIVEVRRIGHRKDIYNL